MERFSDVVFAAFLFLLFLCVCCFFSFSLLFCVCYFWCFAVYFLFCCLFLLSPFAFAFTVLFAFAACFLFLFFAFGVCLGFGCVIFGLSSFGFCCFGCFGAFLPLLLLLSFVAVWSTVLHLLLFGLHYCATCTHSCFICYLATQTHIRQRSFTTLCAYVCHGCFAVLMGKDTDVQHCLHVVLTGRIKAKIYTRGLN